MPRGTRLSLEEQPSASALSDAGFSVKKIAVRLGRSRCVIAAYLRDPDQYNIRNAQGRPRKLSDRQQREIWRKMSNSTNSLSGIRAELSLSVSRTTIWRTIKRNGNIERSVMRRVPRLTDAHRHGRLEFARTNMGTNWAKVIWSDEKKFNLDGCDGQRSYWHDMRKEPIVPRSTLHLPCPFLEEQGEQEYRFQQDNARIHVSRNAAAFLNEHRIPVLYWPPCSPDLNPIENLWGILARKVYANNKQYRTMNGLRLAVVQAWDAIEPGILQNLANSLPSRLFELISGRGGPINY
ncbi:putative transposase [Oesophagostomum dentatum]|uniref:Putative transposase n=1 Tax=Oesophagostomum dentatum TaxID=61180 RepID=A0A0B1SHB3_OESDE|nr:putative transposase [Oesophagostomum dentatum]